MTRRLEARSLSAIVIALFLAGCGFERRGLVPPSPATPGGDGVVGGGGSSGTPMRTPPPATTTVEPATPPAADAAPAPPPPPPSPVPPGPTPPGPTTPNPDTGAPSTPPAVPHDAGPATPPDTAPPPVNECADSSLKLPVQFTVRRAQPAGDDLAFDGDGFLVSFDGRDLTRLARGGMPQMLVARPGRPNSTIDGIEWLPNGSVALADRQNDVVMLLDPGAPPQQRPDAVEIPQPVKIVRAPNRGLYVTSAGGDLFLADPATGHSQSILHTDGHLRGLVYSVDFKSLYIGDSANRTLIAVRIRPDGTVDPPTVLARGLGSFVDGVAIDACGSVYISDNNGGPLMRVTAAGKLEMVSTLDGNDVSGLAFGSGKQGWDDHTLYAVGGDRGNFYEIKIGVRGAPPLP